MMPAASKSSGQNVAFPDICKMPAPPAPFAPAPYPQSQLMSNLKAANLADAQAKAGNQKAQQQVKEAVTQAARISRSMGDEAGTLKGGITSATQAVMFGHTMHVKYNNGSSASGVRIVPSQTKVIVGG